MKMLSALLPCLLALNAAAHVMPEQRGSLNLQGTMAYVAVSIPAAALGSPRLDHPTLARLQTVLQAQVRRRLRLDDAAPPGAAGATAAPAEVKSVLLSLSPAHDELDGSARQLLVMVVAQYPAPPAAPRLQLDFFARSAAQPLTIVATRGVGSAGSAAPERETAVYRPGLSRHAFFVTPLVTPFITPPAAPR